MRRALASAPPFAVLLAALVAVMLATLAPSSARAEGWTFDLHEELTLGLGGALDAPAGLDSRPQLGVRLGASFTTDDGHGFAVQLGFQGDLASDRTPGFLSFVVDGLYVFRTTAGHDEIVTLAVGPSIGYSDAVYADCTSDGEPCTLDDLVNDAFYDGYDALVVGGAFAFAFDHPLGDDPEKGLYLGIVLDGRLLHAADSAPGQGGTLRYAASLGLRFGGRFEL